VDSIVDNFGLAGKGSARTLISDRCSRFADLETPRRHCQVDERGLLSFNLALLDGGTMIGTR
jgi:hypothetical protein